MRKPQIAPTPPALERSATPEAPRPDERELRDVLRKVYLAYDNQAFMATHGLLWKISTTLVESKEDPVRQALGQLLRDAVLREGADRVRTLFGSAADADPSYEKPIQQLIDLFGEYYRHYRIMKVWIGRAGRLVKFAYQEDRDFRRLVERDKEFRDRLRDLSAERRFIRLFNTYNSVVRDDEDLDVIVSK